MAGLIAVRQSLSRFLAGQSTITAVGQQTRAYAANNEARPYSAPSNKQDEKSTDWIAEENQRTSHKMQMEHLRELGADKDNYRDPDPHSGTNTGGTVTGKFEELEQQQTNTGHPDSRRIEKEKLASKEGYDHTWYKPEERAKRGEPDHTADVKHVMSSTAHGEKSIPESAASRVKEAVKESWSTLKHGVNNAGQPEVKSKLNEDSR